jgi:hypothetical protein
MSNITFCIDDFIPFEEGQDYRGYISKDIAIIRKYFGDRTTVEIPVIPIALNGKYGGFGLSGEVRELLATKMHQEQAQAQAQVQAQAQEHSPDSYSQPEDEDMYRDLYNYDDLQFRINPILIDTIREIGFKKASDWACSLYFAGIPANYIDCIHIDEYDGAESIKFDTISAVRNLVTNDTLSFDELQSKLTELAFISMVFYKIANHYK